MTERDMAYRPTGTPEYRDPASSDMTRDYGESSQEKSSSDLRQKAGQQAEAGIDKAAATADRAANQLREKAAQQGGKTGEIGTKVADKLESTSDYLEQHNTEEILDDVERYVKEHPMQAVGVAALGGFVLARILR